ncbi:MAG: hypothetical protein A2Z25_23785 [Planctomycetes bacterium RBG_16_55_9]|nr:MAG: hypothetical protein A2Z25_23785 [Planctomycetes bacterium RBG_16_55_9]
MFDIGQQGYMLLENYPMKPGGRKYEVRLRPTLKVRGTVLDAQTGRPIDKFTVTSGFDHEDGRAPQWDTFTVRTFTGGQYEFEYMQEIFTYRLRIDAERYQSTMSDCIRPREISESQVVIDFKLDKAAALIGKVLSPDGVPLSGAEIVIATDRLRIVNGKPEPRRGRSSEQNLIFHTDANGEFHFESPVSFHTIVVLSERGYAKVSQTEFAASKVITVSPWGRIEGTLRTGAQADVDKLVGFVPEFRRDQEQPNIEFEYEAPTDESGHFTFPRILPDKGVVARITPLDNGARRFSYHIRVEVKSGETARIQIGGTGRPIVGKIIIPDMIKEIFDWQRTDRSLRVSSPIDPPYIVLALECAKDGSFRVEDVPAGEYSLYVHAYGPPTARTFRGERIGELNHAFSVPDMPGGRSDEPLDLGELELEVVGKSAFMQSLIGKPLPDIVNLDISLSPREIESKIVLVCFWDMNQRPSRNCLLQLGTRAQELMSKGVVVIAVQASKADENKLRDWLKENNISFAVGMVRADEEKARFTWGIKSLPWLILTDKNHIVVAEGFALGELDDPL